jgi:hypothetical protein
MRAALRWLTPGGSRQAEPQEDVIPVLEDVEVSSNGDPGTPPGNQGDALRRDLFGADEKYGRFNQGEGSSASSRSKTLPKIDYGKIVTLTLTNFSEYRESIKVVGYARGWPAKYRQPTLNQLNQPWDGEDGFTVQDEVRREAFLVLYQTIPQGLKYLVDNIRSGDVIAVWKVLYERFLFVTASSIKKMKKQWESLGQGTFRLDEFISLVSSKAKSMEMVGITITDQDKATALVHGLSKDFEWLKNYYSTRNHYSFAEAATESLKFAVDKHLLADKPKKTEEQRGSSSSKLVCLDFNRKGCNRKNCRYKHEIVSKAEVREIESKMKRKNEDKNTKLLVVNDKKIRKCYRCGDPAHLSPDCPHKSKLEDFAKQLRNGNAGLPIGELQLPLFAIKEVPNTEWILDSGAVHHITNSLACLIEVVQLPQSSVMFTVGNDHMMSPTHVGSVKLGDLKVSNVYFCKECPVNIVSESRLLTVGIDVNKVAKTGVARASKSCGSGVYPVLEAKLKGGLFIVTQVLICGKLSPL